jgi:hypothetical protein
MAQKQGSGGRYSTTSEEIRRFELIQKKKCLEMLANMEHTPPYMTYIYRLSIIR